MFALVRKVAKHAILTIVAFSLFLGLTPVADAAVSVRGYYKSNGTYVQPYVRSNPNGLKYDNYGYKPSQGLYNSTYGTRGSTWDTPTYITDPDYYQGKSIYDANHGISSYGYSSSYFPAVSKDSLCHDQIGYSSSYDSLSNTCKCSYGNAIDSKTNKCRSTTLICTDQIGIMSQYNSLTKKCECMSGYEYDGISCKYKTKSYSYSYPSSYSSVPASSQATTYTVPTSPSSSSKPTTSSSQSSCVSDISFFDQTNNQCMCRYGINSDGSCQTRLEKCVSNLGEHNACRLTTGGDPVPACEKGYRINVFGKCAVDLEPPVFN